MGWTLQINPTSPVFLFGWAQPELLNLINEWATDFALRYCFIEKDDGFLEILRRATPRSKDEADAIAQIIARLEGEGVVEFIIGG